MPTPPSRDQSLQYISIKDFSPGVYQYSLGTTYAGGGLPVTYAPNAPLGSAAYSYRCINKPNIGLCPMPAYKSYGTVNATTYAGSGGGALTSVESAAFVTIGPSGQTYSSAYAGQSVDVNDTMFFMVNGLSSAGHWVLQWYRLGPNSSGTAFGTPVTVSSNDPYVGTLNLRSAPCFYIIPKFTMAGGVTGANWYVTIALGQSSSASSPPSGLYVMPAMDSSAEGELINPTSIGLSIPLGACGINAGGRQLILRNYVNTYFPNTPVSEVRSDTSTLITDPAGITQNTITLSSNIFDPTNLGGYSAWGSISTGELFMVHPSGGAVSVAGDPLAPTSVTILPGVTGTGRITQEATSTSQGLLYITELDGVQMWNGGNTSQKISTQIPDDACVGGDISNIGISTQHDAINNLAFLPNNWIYDLLSGSWWQSENPSIINFDKFRSSYANQRYMWATTLTGDIAPGQFNIYGFNFLTFQSSYEWMSNPIVVTKGGYVPTLEHVEIVASNPTAVPATITVTPTVPTGQVPYGSNQNPSQPLTFTIPAHTSGYRLSQECGYTDYNIQLKVQAANNSTYAAPVLHEITVGWTDKNPTAAN